MEKYSVGDFFVMVIVVIGGILKIFEIKEIYYLYKVNVLECFV